MLNELKDPLRKIIKGLGFFLLHLLREYGMSLLVAFVLAMGIQTFIVKAYKIPTPSMVPTLNVGDRLLVNRFIYRFKEPQRGDIIVFEWPEDRKKDFIKRLIGLPGETIEIANGIIYVNGKAVEVETIRKNDYTNTGKLGGIGQEIKVPDDSYYVLGDNSANSSDSRVWGFIKIKKVKGRAWFVYWPLTKMRLLQ